MYKIGSVVYVANLFYMIVENTEKPDYYIVSTPLGIRSEMYISNKTWNKGPQVFEPGDEYYDTVLEDFREKVKFNLEEVNLEYISKFINALQRVYE